MIRQNSNSAPVSPVRARTIVVGGSKEDGTDQVPKQYGDDHDAAGGGGLKAITVMARFRPEDAMELANGGVNCVQYHPNKRDVTISSSPKDRDAIVHSFRFDRIFPSYATQRDVFEHVCHDNIMIENFVQGVNCSILTFGQTGTGKTYTMMGVIDESTGKVIGSPGLIPSVFDALFARLDDLRRTHTVEFQLNFLELYCEQLYDLLDEDAYNRSTNSQVPNHLRGVTEKIDIFALANGTMRINGCTSLEKVTRTEQALAAIQRGLGKRATAATKQNKVSSRSHAIVVATLHSNDNDTKLSTYSQMYLVDLAGSERVTKTQAQGLALHEAKSINTSLFTLKQVISALTAKVTTTRHQHHRVHVPYRDSKLTRLLENSLGGNALTSVIVTCSPSTFNFEETLSTLRFGADTQLIKTAPKRNQERTAAELEILLEKAEATIAVQRAEIRLLKGQNMLSSSAPTSLPSSYFGDTSSSSSINFSTTFIERAEPAFVPSMTSSFTSSSSSSSWNQRPNTNAIIQQQEHHPSVPTLDISKTSARGEPITTVQRYDDCNRPQPYVSSSSSSSSSTQHHHQHQHPMATTTPTASTSSPSSSSSSSSFSENNHYKWLQQQCAMLQHRCVRLSNLLTATAICPITQKPFTVPVLCLDGYTYERKAIHRTLISNDMRSPLTHEKVPMDLLIPNLTLSSLLKTCVSDLVLLQQDTNTNTNPSSSNNNNNNNNNSGGEKKEAEAAFVVEGQQYHTTALVAPLDFADVFDLVWEIMDFIPRDSSWLRYAKVNVMFARVCLDRRRWKKEIEEKLLTYHSSVQIAAKKTSLPAHELWVLLQSGDVIISKTGEVISSRSSSSSRSPQPPQYVSKVPLTLYSSSSSSRRSHVFPEADEKEL